ncbi:unnamed protein product, partial [marine sediment metagenome]
RFLFGYKHNKIDMKTLLNLIIILMLACSPIRQHSKKQPPEMIAIFKLIPGESLEVLTYDSLHLAGEYFGRQDIKYFHVVGSRMQEVNQRDLEIAGVRNLNIHDNYK